MSLGRTIVSGTAWSVVGRLGVVGFGFIAQALLARVLEPRDFGAYSLIFSLAGLVAMASQFGLPQSTVRHIAAANAAPEGSRARPAISTSATLAVLAAALACGLVLLPGGRLLAAVYPDSRLRAVLGLFAVLVGIRVLENITPELFRGVRDFRGGSIFGGLLSTGLLAAIAGGVAIWAGTVSLDAALVIGIAASATSLLAAAILLWRKVQSLPPAPRERVVNLRLVSPAIWFAAIITYSIAQLDLWVVGALGSGEQIARYSAAFRLSTLVTVPLMIVNFVVPPLVVDLLAKQQPKRLELAVQTVATVAGAPALVGLILFTAFGPWICEVVYGDFYRAAGAPLALLSIGKLAGVLAGSCGSTLIMSGGQAANLRILALNLVVTLPFQIAGFTVAGLAGLAAATSVGFALQNLHQVVAVRRRIGVRTEFNLSQTVRLARDVASKGQLRALLLERSTPGAKENV